MTTASTPAQGTGPLQLHGPAPLTPRLEPWMHELLRDAAACRAMLDAHASPVNVIDTSPLGRNVRELTDVADEFGVDLFTQVARKANKALAVVDEARDLGLGVDVGSEAELRQVLSRGVDASRIVVTAAVKPRSLLLLCLESGALVALDNLDEAALVAALAAEHGVTPRVALRLQPPSDGPWVSSRFGEQVATWAGWLATSPGVDVVGLHFHLHGYDAAARAAMLRVAFAGIDAGAFCGHDITFVDIGGGVPMSYLDDGSEWDEFWSQHRERLDGPDPLTWQAHPLSSVYPYHQQLVRGDWLRALLGERASGTAPVAGAAMAKDVVRTEDTARRGPCDVGPTIADELRARHLQLRLEPGRAVLDGVGMTLARVAFRKRTSDGTRVVGLEMNRTQCRSTSDDFLVDPLLVRADASAPSLAGSGSAPAGAVVVNEGWGAAVGDTDGPVSAFLVGAYCIENELLLTRRIEVPRDIQVGDIIAFPNTGGYLMHILESASHQIPLARNVSRRSGETSFTLDAIDAEAY